MRIKMTESLHRSLVSEHLFELLGEAKSVCGISIDKYKEFPGVDALACKDIHGDEWIIASDEDVPENIIFSSVGDDDDAYIGTYNGKSYFIFWASPEYLRRYFDMSIFRSL